jgi:hypothetical protein
VLVDDVEQLLEVAVVDRRVELVRRRVRLAVAQHPVVGGGIGKHGDPARPEQRAEHEDVVLEPPRPLGEAQPVLREVRLAEQPVRREQPGVLGGQLVQPGGSRSVEPSSTKMTSYSPPSSD